MNILTNGNATLYNGSTSVYFITSPIDCFIKPHGSFTIKTGVKIALSDNEIAEVVSNPTMEKNYGLTCHEIYLPTVRHDEENGIKDVYIHMENHSRVAHSIKAGDRIALLIPLTQAHVTDLDAIASAPITDTPEE